MPAQTVGYLYEDLPDGHIVTNVEWNDALQRIKDTLNNHASLIDTKIEAPKYILISDWIEVSDGYKFEIPQTEHGKGLFPRVRVFDSNNYEIFGSHTIDSSTGLITIYSVSNKISLIIEVR